VVRTGRAAEETLRLAAEDSVDLILIATHGRDGMTRWRLGSVADKIVRQATCPTLVVGPNVVLELAPHYLRRILVPLTGHPSPKKRWRSPRGLRRGQAPSLSW
jgi:hypothetical protein